MAARKMTFTIPEELALTFTKSVPARERSVFVVQALAERLAARKRRLIRSCEAANADNEVRQIERDFDSLPDPASER